MNGTVKSGCAEIVATEKKIILILLGFVIAFSFKCGTRYDPSVNRYSYLYKVDKEKYLSDSTYFVFQINDLIKQKQDPFYTGEFDSLTEIFIDTILYNDKHDKFAFFAITKNSNDKFLKRGSATEFHFDGFFFIGSLLNGS